MLLEEYEELLELSVKVQFPLVRLCLMCEKPNLKVIFSNVMYFSYLARAIQV